MLVTIKSDEPGSEQQAVEMIADIIHDFYPVNQQCVLGLNSMVAVFDQYMRIFTKPLEIFFNTIYYYKAIFHLMSDGVACAFNLDVGCLGYNSGVMFYKIFYVKR